MRPKIESVPFNEKDLQLLENIRAGRSGWKKMLIIALTFFAAALIIILYASQSAEGLNNYFIIASGILSILGAIFLSIALMNKSSVGYLEKAINGGNKNVLIGTLTHKRSYANRHSSNCTFEFGPNYQLSLSREEYDKFQVGDILQVTFSFFQPRFLDLELNYHADYFELITPAADNKEAVEDLKRFDDELNAQLSGNEDKNKQLKGELKKFPQEAKDKQRITKYYLSRVFVVSILGSIGCLILYLNPEGTGIWPYIIMGGAGVGIVILLFFLLIESFKNYKWLELRYIDDIKSAPGDNSEYIYVKINGAKHTLKRADIEQSDLQQPVILHRTPWRKYAFDYSLRQKE